MTRRAFLHVGSPKTGTTYLQAVLWASTRQLRSQGLMMPLRLRDSFELSLVMREAVDPETDDVRLEEVLDRFADALSGHDADVLISHELLATATPDGVQRLMTLLDAFEVHVVVTARDWERQLPAEWQQMVKTRLELSYDQFLARVASDPRDPLWVRQDFAAVAAAWGGNLPARRVHIVTVPPPGASPHLLLDRFCTVLGIDPASLAAEQTHANPSLTHEGAELMRRVNLALGTRLPKPRGGYNRVAKFWFAEKMLAPIPGTRLSLPTEHQQWCREASHDQVNALAAAGYDVVGDLADLIARPGEAGSAPATLDDRALLEVALEGIAGALVQRLDDLHTIDRLRAEVRALRRAPTDPPVAPAPAAPDPVRGPLARLARRVRGARE